MDKYEKALERCKKEFNFNNLAYSHEEIKQKLERIFPELKESEDERIRKQLLNWFKDCSWDSIDDGNLKREDIIAWLEKQGEQNNKHLYDVIIALWDLLDKIDTFSDLQIDDTNPDNPFKKIEYIAQERHKFVKSDGYNLYIQGEQITDFKQSKQNPTWSEEDERNLEGIINEIEANKNNAPDYDLATYDRFLSWLKSLKDRVQPQPKQEWSEEEKARIDKIIDVLDWAEKKGHIRYSYWEDYVCYVKSLKPQNTWKPSDGQIKQLGWVAEQNKDNMIGKELMTLYNDLKRLREE